MIRVENNLPKKKKGLYHIGEVLTIPLSSSWSIFIGKAQKYTLI